MKRIEVLSFLKSCNEFEICDLFYEAFLEKKEFYREEDNGPEMIDNAFVIVNSVLRDPPADFTIIAMPNNKCESYVSNEMTQNGFCKRCRVEMAGFAKDSVCPICGEQVWMT
jgi:hypothetical protein